MNSEISEISAEAGEMLVDILDRRLEADRSMRDTYLNVWQRNWMYWDNQQELFWDEAFNRWRTIEEGRDDYGDDIEDNIEEQHAGINFYRARGESVIAAMTTAIPKTVFFPDNADDPDDVSTSMVYTHGAELLQIQNKSEAQDIEASTNLWIFGKAYGFTHGEANPAFGTERVPTRNLVSVEKAMMSCDTCGYKIEDEDGMADGVGEESECPECQMTTHFSQVMEKMQEEREGFDDVPATRQIVEIHSPVEVNVAPWAMTMKQSPYLVYTQRLDVSQARAMYPKYARMISEVESSDKITEFENSFLLPDGSIETPPMTTLLRHVWLRPWTFDPVDAAGDEGDYYDDDEMSAASIAMDLQERFPEGVYCLFCGDELVFARAENVDKHWAETMNPLERRGLANGVGEPFIHVQNMISENVNLLRDAIKHSVPITFADSRVIDPEQYRESRAGPGDLYPVEAPADRPIRDMVHSESTSTLPKGAEGFIEYLDRSGQTVVADHPSIHGGAGSGSKTFGEYRLAQNQAMQRIRIPWRSVGLFKSEIYGKAVTQYLEYLVANRLDKNFSKREDGEFVNVWINSAAASGKIGRVHPESNEAFPLNNAQKRDIVMELSGNAIFAPVLTDPGNARAVESIMGVGDLKIPGAAERDWQMREIKTMLEQPPPADGDGNPGVGEDGQPRSSMPPSMTDNHELHSAIIQQWCTSEEGWDTKANNPEGWANIQSHWMEHQVFIREAKQAMVEMGEDPQAETNPSEQVGMN